MSNSHRWTFHRSDLFKKTKISQQAEAATPTWLGRKCWLVSPLAAICHKWGQSRIDVSRPKMVVSESERPEMKFSAPSKCLLFIDKIFIYFFFFCRFELQNSHGPKVRGQCISSDRLPVRKRPARASQAARCELRQPRYNHYETPKLVALPSICWLSLWRVYVDCKLISREAQI